MSKRLIVGILLLSFLCGCASNNGAGGKENVKILLSVNQMDTFRQTLVDAALIKAKEEGATLDVLDAGGVIENQVDHMKKAAKEGYDIIICSPVSTDTVVELKASADGLPIVFFNSCPSDKQLKDCFYVYAGSDEQVAGEYQAEYVLENFKTKNEISVVIIGGSKGHSATVGRTNGIKKVLSQSGKTINYVFEDYADWDTGKAYDIFSIFLKTGVKADCVLCNNDAMALGVIQCMEEKGISTNDMMVLGVDATVDGCDSIKEGKMAFTVYQSGSGQGNAAVEMALRIVRGDAPEQMEGITENGKYVWVPFEKVDSNNVGNYGK